MVVMNSHERHSRIGKLGLNKFIMALCPRIRLFPENSLQISAENRCRFLIRYQFIGRQKLVAETDLLEATENTISYSCQS